MNKPLYFKICSVSVSVFLIVWLVIFGIFMARKKAESKAVPNPAEVPAKEVQRTVPTAETSHYFVRAKDEKIAVWKVYSNGYSQPVPIPDIPLDSLTEYDRVYFEEGFVIEDESSLASLIEDFTS